MKIWKRDHYPGMHLRSLQEPPDPQPFLSGAPNFRQLPGRSIYGLGQPSVEGLPRVLEIVGPCLWVNLREEAVLYLDGRSCSLRDSEQPLLNPISPGIRADDLEAFEDGLEQEVVARGHVCVSDEREDLSVYEECGIVTAATIREVFTRPAIDYHRVPVSDEQAPEVGDFQDLYLLLKDCRTARVFNCHAGRGRTTTAMIIADLIEKGPKTDPATLEERTPVENSLWKAVASCPSSQSAADAAIARSARLQDLKASIESQAPAQQGYAASPAAALAVRTRDYLKRYFLLLAFAEFLEEGGDFRVWLAERPERRKMLTRLGRALGLAD